jgi:TPR repeat protein
MEAVRLYKLVAEQGHALGQFRLALCLRNGHGVVKNKSEAMRYLKLAAHQGHADAAAEIAKFWF